MLLETDKLLIGEDKTDESEKWIHIGKGGKKDFSTIYSSKSFQSVNDRRKRQNKPVHPSDPRELSLKINHLNETTRALSAHKPIKKAGMIIYRLHKDDAGNDTISFLMVMCKTSQKWGFPKGHIEINDYDYTSKLQTCRNCAVREVREETTLNINLTPADPYVIIYETIYFVVPIPDDYIVDLTKIDAVEIIDIRLCTLEDITNDMKDNHVWDETTNSGPKIFFKKVQSIQALDTKNINLYDKNIEDEGIPPEKSVLRTKQYFTTTNKPTQKTIYIPSAFRKRYQPRIPQPCSKK